MSQKIVFELLKELGGRATTKDVRKLAREKYPDLSLFNYTSHQLRKLEKWGYIKSSKRDDGKLEYEIIKDLEY